MTIIADLLFLVIWLIVPFIWLYLLKLSGMSILNLSIPSFVVTFILIFQYIGYPVLYFELDDYRAEFIHDRNLIVVAWLITSITTSLLILGSSLGSQMLNCKNRNSMFDSKMYDLPGFSIRRLYVLAIIGISVLMYFVLTIGLDNLALIMAIRGAELTEISVSRSKMGNDFGVGYHWFNFFMRDMLIFISYVFLTLRFQRRSQVSLTAIILLVILIIFSLLMATEKGLFVDYVISMAVLNFVLKNKSQISFGRSFYLFLFAIVATLVGFYMVFMGDAGVVAGLSSIVSRAFTGSMQPIYHYLEFFPKHHDWLYGSSFPNPGSILPFKPYNLPVEVMNFVQPNHLELDVVGTMPAIYWGEIYANFGYFGLFFAPVGVGFVLYVIHYIISKLPNNPLSAALFVWMLMHYKNLSITSVSMFVFDFNLYMILIVYFLIRIRLLPASSSVTQAIN